MERITDIVVVGSGSGGAPVARRLVEAGYEVTVIEAGADTLGVTEIEDPGQWFGLQVGRWDWGHAYAPNPRLDGRAIPIPRGRALGGSSATNAMMWYRGTPADYARWEARAPGWGWDDCLPAFRACESWAGPAHELRGTDGPLVISRGDPAHPLTRAMLEGGAAMGLEVIDDPNGPEVGGVGLANFNIAGGRRWTSADGYLRPLKATPALQVATRTRALEVTFEGDRATGIATWGPEGAGRVTARRGVVLAAGALETPRLLMLSGIGPEAELARLGIPCRIRAEGVGQNLQDHPLLRALNFRAAAPLGPMRGNGGGTLTIWKSDPSLDEADLLAFPIQGRSAVPAVKEAYDLDGDIFAIGAGVMRSHSVGQMRLTGASVDDPLEIDPNLLADARDRDALRAAVTFLQDMVATPAFAEMFAGFAAPDTRVSGEALDAFIRRATSTFFHCCGTAQMGTDDDAPVAPDLAVKGARGLWVADASVIPVIPACHTHAPVTMIGERAASFIKEAL